jgi:hypothetical protein
MMGSSILWTRQSIALSFHHCHLVLSAFVIKSFIFLQFFEMPRHEAIAALDIYKRAGQQVMLSINYFILSTPKIFINTSLML